MTDKKKTHHSNPRKSRISREVSPDTRKQSLYFPADLHAAIDRIAVRERRSFNQQIMFMLQYGKSVDDFDHGRKSVKKRTNYEEL